MLIVIPIFDRLTAPDAVGPYEILSRIPGASVQFVAAEPGEKRDDRGSLGLTADTGLDEVPRCEVVLVPGGPGHLAAAKDERLCDWLRAVDATTTFTTSVCTGSLILGAAGLLKRRRATTHWLSVEHLREHGLIHDNSRVVTDGKYITAAGGVLRHRHGLDLDRTSGGRPHRTGHPVERRVRPPATVHGGQP